MDGLSDTFGRLSTDAAEWKPQQYPQSNNQQNHPYQSDLKATAVKEFVPGKAWSTQPTSPQQQQQQKQSTSTTTSTNPISTSSLSAQSQPFQSTQHAPTVAATNDQLLYHNEIETQQHRHLGTSTVPAGPPPPPLPSFRTLHSMGLSDSMWRYHRELALEAHRQMDPSDPRHRAVPLPYYNAFCMDAQQKSSSRSSFGYPSDTFKAVSREDGNLYCVRRFDNVRCVSPRIAVAVTEKWSASTVQEHPGIVPLYRCFISKRAVFFVHHYVPGARTLKERLEGPLLEAVIWSAVVQLTSAIRAVHAANLAVRNLDLKHVLSNTDATGSRLRLRLNCLGVVDALEFEARKNVVDLQNEDIRDMVRTFLKKHEYK